MPTSTQHAQEKTHVVDNYVNGKHVASTSGRGAALFNPATGEESGWVGFSNSEDVAGAVAAAKQAYPAWANTPPLKRATYLFKFKALLDKHREDIARHISAEHGKTHLDALGEVTRGIEVVDLFPCNDQWRRHSQHRSGGGDRAAAAGRPTYQTRVQRFPGCL